MESRAVVSKMTKVHLGLLHYVYKYWFFCHLADLSLNNLPVLKSSGTLEASWTREALVIYCVGVKGVWSCGLQFSECWSVPVADAISYGFPLSKRFASAFVPSSWVKEKDILCTWSIHPFPEQPTLLQSFLFFYTLHTFPFVDGYFHRFHPILFKIWLSG